MLKKGSKKGQIAMWVILALVIAGGILLFVYIQNRPSLTTGEAYDPRTFIEGCIGKAVIEAKDRMLPQGGFLEPKVFKIYNDTNVTYLCKRDDYYKTCINLHPMLINDIINELKGYINARIEQCFSSLQKEAEKRGIDIVMKNDMNLTVGLAPGIIRVIIDREISITEKGSSYSINKFEANVLSRIYELTNVAITIVNSEAKYCSFEYVGYMALDRGVDIRKWTMSDSTKIYSLTDKLSGEKMNIAIRGCAIPLGI